MTTIIFYNNELHDTQAPSRTLRLQAGRGGDPEHFFLSNGCKSVFLDPKQANEFLGALDKMDRCVRGGKFVDKEFYSGDIQSYDGKTMGIDLGILVGRPYLAIEDTRIDVSADDVAFFAAACRQAHYLAGGIGVAGKLARTPPARPWWQDYTRRFIYGPGSQWFDD